MDEIIKTRDSKIKWMKRLKVWLGKVKQDITYDALEVRLVRLDEVWKELVDIEQEIAAEDPDVDLKADEFEDEFFTIKSELLGLMRPRKVTNSPNTSTTDATLTTILNQIFNQQQTFLDGLNTTTRSLAHVTEQDSVKLPKVSMSSFDGVYRNWPSFEDAFTSSVHNNAALSGVTKLKLLKRLLMTLFLQSKIYWKLRLIIKRRGKK